MIVPFSRLSLWPSGPDPERERERKRERGRGSFQLLRALLFGKSLQENPKNRERRNRGHCVPSRKKKEKEKRRAKVAFHFSPSTNTTRPTMLRQAASSLRRAAGEGLVRRSFGSFATARRGWRRRRRGSQRRLNERRRRGVAELANGCLKNLSPLCAFFLTPCLDL